jgi:hypothetical protein
MHFFQLLFFLFYFFIFSLGDSNQLNVIYNALIVSEEQKTSDRTFQTYLTTTKHGPTFCQPLIVPNQEMMKPKHPSHPNRPSSLEVPLLNTGCVIISWENIIIFFFFFFFFFALLFSILNTFRTSIVTLPPLPPLEGPPLTSPPLERSPLEVPPSELPPLPLHPFSDESSSSLNVIDT